MMNRWTDEEIEKVMPLFLAVKAEQARRRQKCVKCGVQSAGAGDWPFDHYCPDHVPEGWVPSRRVEE